MCITILSLVVAGLAVFVSFLAVFVGPMILSRIADRQIRTSLEIGNKQIVAPMRQAWINKLRNLLAEFISSANEYHVVGVSDKMVEERQRFFLLAEKIGLMLNPKEDDHERLRMLTVVMAQAMLKEKLSADKFACLSDEVRSLSKTILKREWDRVKEPISVPGAVSDAQGP